jgi:O-antigen/teichoic acid export membrane protein
MINLGGAIVNVSLNLILIPYWGVIGAAVTALVTQIFTNVIMSAILKPLRESNMFILRGLRPDNLKRFFHLIFRRIRRR